MQIAVVSAHPGDLIIDKARWMADGFSQAGHDVRRCHSLSDVKAADAACDLLVFDHKSAGMSHVDLANLASSKRSVWVQWWRDLIDYEPGVQFSDQPYLKTFRRLMAGMDVCFVKERAKIEEFKALGINAVWLDQACPAEMPACEHRETPDWDVLVIGHAGYQQRRSDVRCLVDAGYRVVWASLPSGDMLPPGVECHPWVHPIKELPALASRCACALSVDIRQDVPGYTSDRTWLLAGIGVPVIARVPDLATEEGIQFMPQVQAGAWIYSDHDGLLTVTKLAMPLESRAANGMSSREFVMRSQTYRNRAEKIIAYIESLQAALRQ